MWAFRKFSEFIKLNLFVFVWETVENVSVSHFASYRKKMYAKLVHPTAVTLGTCEQPGCRAAAPRSWWEPAAARSGPGSSTEAASTFPLVTLKTKQDQNADTDTTQSHTSRARNFVVKASIFHRLLWTTFFSLKFLENDSHSPSQEIIYGRLNLVYLTNRNLNPRFEARVLLCPEDLKKRTVLKSKAKFPP